MATSQIDLDHSWERAEFAFSELVSGSSNLEENNQPLNYMKKAIVQPYLFFGGRCEEALEFYRGAIGAQVEVIMRYKESPEPPPPGMLPAGFENKVMHATFRIGESILMGSDGCSEGTNFNGFSLSISAPSEAEADRAFAALAVGGKITMPLAKTFWSPRFGMLTDRFGVGWMISVMA